MTQTGSNGTESIWKKFHSDSSCSTMIFLHNREQSSSLIYTLDLAELWKLFSPQDNVLNLYQ